MKDRENLKTEALGTNKHHSSFAALYFGTDQGPSMKSDGPPIDKPCYSKHVGQMVYGNEREKQIRM